ncbi:hypothetical protein T459_28411 [Capsicum annuum]|uniref:F-box domain-containing protein n=1 Tax=Capsicum annuum TaxID=4072 RepID=A0A2G2YGP6_CAPAN|nr:hypothetical protein T459_28411 [Capsicum annuum]
MSDSNSCNSRHFSWLMKSCFPNTQQPPPHHPTPIPTTTTISSLPDDLLLECLSRVAHSSLPHLPLVCSRWAYLLDSPIFHLLRIRNHLVCFTLFVVSCSDGALLTASYRLENDNEWNISSLNYPFFENGFRVLAIGRRIYVIGRTVMLRCDTWTGKVVELHGPVNLRKKFAAAVVGGKIYVAGGSAGATAVEEYDPKSEKWRVFNGVRKSSGFGEWRRIKSPPLPAQVRLDSTVRFSCEAIGEKVVLVQVNGCIDDLLRRSGRPERGMKEGLVLVYDCVVGEWSRGVDLPEVIRRSACVCVEC